MTAFNRTIVALAIIGLAAWLGYLCKVGTFEIKDAVLLVAAASQPAGIYIGVKGPGK